MVTGTCPTREAMFDYLVGRLDDEASQSLADHLESCPDCQAALATLDDADDTLVAQLRSRETADPLLDESACDAAIARAKAVAGRAAGDGSPGVPMPEQLGEYTLLEELGHGGMGAVYKALHTKLDRVVALKVLPKGRLADAKAVARFEREMKAVGRLDHPHIVRAHDAREIDDTPVLVMEYVDGLDLAEVVRRLGPVPANDACELIRQAALGLQCAFEHGLVHRDVKPSNLMLASGGTVKVLDLGLARFQADAGGEEMTGTGQMMGTADYMAPEQVSDSREADVRADIYSLGCTLYKLLSGRAPFSGPQYLGKFDKMSAHVQETAPAIREIAPDVPEELAAIVDRMLAKSPEDRFATPAEVAEALEPLCAGADLSGLLSRAEQQPPPSEEPSRADAEISPPSPKLEPRPLLRRRVPVLVTMALMLMAFGAGVASGILIRITKDGRVTEVEVPDGASAKITPEGHVEVDLDRVRTPSATAVPDAQAIQGTWQVVSSSLKLFDFIDHGKVVEHDEPLYGSLEPPAPAEEIFKTTHVVITDDVFKIVGKHVVDEAYKYRLNTEPKTRMIDLECGGKLALGIYRLEGDRLRICVDIRREEPVTMGLPGPPLPTRPTALWADLGSKQDLLVLRRVGEAKIHPDELAIQGTWEVVSTSLADTPRSPNLSMGGMGPGDYYRTLESAAPILKSKGQKMRITRRTIRVQYPRSANMGMGGMGMGEMGMEMGGAPAGPQGFLWVQAAEYAIDPTQTPKTIDFVVKAQTDPSTDLGIYRLEGDRLTLCIGPNIRPEEFAAQPGGSDQAQYQVPYLLYVLKRVAAAEFPPEAEQPQPAPASAEIPRDHRVVAIKAKLGEGFQPAPGDRVDVVFEKKTGKRPKGMPEVVNLLLIDVQVIAVASPGANSEEAMGEPADTTTVSLLVAPHHAEILTKASTEGTFRLVPHGRYSATIQGLWRIVSCQTADSPKRMDEVSERYGLPDFLPDFGKKDAPSKVLITARRIEWLPPGEAGYSIFFPRSTEKLPRLELHCDNRVRLNAAYRLEGDRLELIFAFDRDDLAGVADKPDGEKTLLLKLEREAPLSDLSLDLDITSDGSVRIDGRNQDEESLEKAIRLLLDEDPDLAVRIRCPPGLPWERAVKWIEFVEELGVRDVMFAAAETEGSRAPPPPKAKPAPPDATGPLPGQSDAEARNLTFAVADPLDPKADTTGKP